MHPRTDAPAPHLPAAIRTAAEALAATLEELARGDLLGITLIGAAAVPAVGGVDDELRSIVLLRRVDVDMLRQLAERGEALGRHSVAAPLIMTPDYIAASRDTFPLELLEAHQFHLPLRGADLFATLTLETADVRLSVEREFKQVKLALRQALLASGGREWPLSDAIDAQVERIVRALRGLLWFRGQRRALPRPEVLRETETLTGRALPGLSAAALRPGPHDFGQFRTLYEELELLTEVADAAR